MGWRSAHDVRWSSPLQSHARGLTFIIVADHGSMDIRPMCASRRFASLEVFLVVALLVVVPLACTMYEVGAQQRRQYRDANALLHQQGDGGGHYLKAHLHSGDLVIFDPAWVMDTVTHRLEGNAKRYGVERAPIAEGHVVLSFDSIAILETNRPIRSRDRNYRTTLITISVMNAVMTGYCVMNPKACFGSCPTFYLPGDEGLFSARAEGFSSAIYPALQYADVDQLGVWADDGEAPRVIMKNEALETQVVDRLWLEAFPVVDGEEVRMAPDGAFWRCSGPVPLSTARQDGKDVAAYLRADDGAEWWSRADTVDLRSTGTLELSFERNTLGQRPALAITFRQTLLTTFLLYTALGYMGNEVSDHIAGLEGDAALRKRTAGELHKLQDMRVEVMVNGRWQEVAVVRETGPIARNRTVVPLPPLLDSEASIRLRLHHTPGMYRVDHAGLVDLCGEVIGERLSPAALMDQEGCSVPGLVNVYDRDAHKLCTLPGDVHAVAFERPVGRSRQWHLFLGADGYYLEWMRREWLQHTDADRLRAMLLGRDAEWRALTKEYKAMEEEMDAVFWNSQWTHPL
jgi:hypothetical protein